jgi:citrate lyase gamma subunit
LTEAQIEAALERTIEKIYGEKIEQLMIRTIEKTVTREIARIKNALLEDEDDKIG